VLIEKTNIMNIKRVFTISVFLILSGFVFAQKGVVNSGAKIIITGNAILDIEGGSEAGYTNETSGSDHGRIDLDGKIILTGDWTNNASGGNVLIDLDGDGEVIFSGSSTQNIGGSGVTDFEKLKLNNSGGLILGEDIYINGYLTFETGKITIGNYNLTLGTSSDILQYSDSKFIVASGTGELRKEFSAPGSFLYPVGDNSGTVEYSPAKLNFFSGTFGGSAYAGVNVTDSKHANNTSTTDFLSRYWTVNQNNISGFSCGVTLYYKDTDINGTENNIYCGQWESPNWIKLNSANTTNNQLTGTVNTFSDFTGGENSEFSISVSMTDDGLIPEAAENGEEIVVTLTNEEFVGSLDAGNWTIDNLTPGVTKGTVTRDSDTQATITLSGNRTIDYDSDITNVTVTIGVDELVFSTSDLVAGTGVTLIANNDAESIAISDDGIYEGSEDGENITVILSGGTFVGSLTPSNWTLSNLPGGVTKNSVTRNSATQVTITLSGNRTTDYDTDITDLEVSIADSEIDEHSGNDISISTGVTFSATVESSILVHAGLTESNLNGALIELELVNETFNDVTLDKTNFSLNNAPPGTLVDAVNYINTDTATVTLAFNGIDFDIDYTDFSITISAGELSGAGSVTSNTLTITANIEAATAVITHAGLTEENLNTADIDFTFSAETFADATLDPANFILGNAPDGTTVNAVAWNSTTNATVTLAFDGTDFDNNITNFYIVVGAIEVSGGSSVASSTLPITATDDDESISMTDDSEITEGNEDSEIITVTLTGGTFVDPLTTGNWVLTNLPAGIAKGALVRTDATHATLALTGNRTTDYDSDITNLMLSITTDEINDTSGADITTNTGVTFIANYESVTISHIGLDENNLNGAVVGIKLSNETFKDNSLDLANFTINNVPPGTTNNAISYEGADTATITLAFDGTDFDIDYDFFSVTIDESELSGLTALTSNELVIVAIDEPGVLTISHTGLTEGNLDNADLSLTLDQETFADASLIPTNFTLFNVPAGVSIGVVTYLSSTTATLTLVFDGTDFDSNISDFNISISAAELTGTVDLTSNNLVISATDDDESIFMTDDGAISEGTENGEVITVTLSGGTFVSTLTPGNWFFTGLPDGLSILDITRDNATQASITLSGNRTTDYDANITNVLLNVDAAEVNDYTGADLTTTGIVFTAIVESASISHTGLTENNLDGAEISLKLTNESFNDPDLSIANFNLNNAPAGTTVNAVTYYGTDTATITLAFDGTDFDTDSTNFNIIVDASELTGAGDVLSDSLTITAVIESESESVSITDPGLTEENLDGSVITIILSNVEFTDVTLDVSNFVLNNAPAGTTVGAISYVDVDTATLTISYDGSDFDNSIENFSITISASEITGLTDLISNNISITATVEPGILTISHTGLTEENLDEAVIGLVLTEVTFVDATLNPANFTLNNAPSGTSVSSVTYTGSAAATVTLAYDGSDFDTDVFDFSITINSAELSGGTALTGNTLTIVASVENESVTISFDGLSGDKLDGAGIEIELFNVSFADTIPDKANYTLNNVPAGTGIDTVIFSDLTHATLTVEFDGTVFNDTIYDFSITISSIELTGLDDLVSNDLIISPVTGISPYLEAPDINMYSFENRIFIECSDPEKLKEVAIYNILGSELIRRKLDKNPVNEISLDTPGNYYIIRVYTTDNKVYSKKLLIYLR